MILKYNSKDLDLAARLMRAEALGEGEDGMLRVGNVIVNRALANCLTFKNVRTIPEVVYQNPGGFAGKDSPLFFSNATAKEKELAEKILKYGQYFFPATHALWFYAPGKNSCRPTWYDQELAGKYKNHCFYKPDAGTCHEIY